MKNKLFLLLFVFCVQFGFSQQIPREVLNGQIVADSISVENVQVLNKNTNTFSISDRLGHFHIYAREKDTLVFSSQSFESKKLILTPSDLKVQLLRIQLQVFVNALDEVVISPQSLTGELERDHKNIKITEIKKINNQSALDQLYENDNQSTPDNTAMPGYVNTRYMADFMAIGKKIGKLFRKKDASKPVIIYTSDKIFPEAVQQNLPDSFFRDTLKLNKDEVGLFLSFCESDPKAGQLLDPKRKFELIDFLITKNKEYKALEKE